MALGDFGSWTEVIDRAWQLGAQHPAHLVGDGDGAIAAGIELVYGGEAPHQLRAFHLLREYRRNIGRSGICGGAAAAECGQFGGRSGMGAANYAGDGWGGSATGARKRCPKDCAIWRRGRWRIGRRRVWSG